MRFLKNISHMFHRVELSRLRRCRCMYRTVSLLLIWLIASNACKAGPLTKLLELALNGEPTYQGAKSNLQASEARSKQALGALLPQVNLSVNTNNNNRGYATRNINSPTEKDAYNSNSGQLNITQGIWRYANIVSVQQADAVLEQTQHQLMGTEQELFTKLVVSWFDVLAARDNIEFTKQQVMATRKQWDVNLRGVEFGTSGMPQAQEAKAKYDQALSDAISAETDSHIKIATLEQLVGTSPYLELPYLRNDVYDDVRDGIVWVDLKADRLEKWLAAVETSNPNILAAQKAFEAADAEIRKQKAGHHPTLDLVGTYSNNSQAVGGFPGQNGYDIRQRSIGLQLNIPLFSGGTQSAKVSEAVAMREKARADIEAARRTALLTAKQGWFGWQAAHAKIQAGIQEVAAAKIALKVAYTGSENGLKSELDVLQAEQQFYAGLRDLRKGYYDQIASYVKLKAAAGRLTQEDIESIDRLFVTSPLKEIPIEPERIVPTPESNKLLLKASLSLSK